MLKKCVLKLNKVTKNFMFLLAPSLFFSIIWLFVFSLAFFYFLEDLMWDNVGSNPGTVFNASWIIYNKSQAESCAELQVLWFYM